MSTGTGAVLLVDDDAAVRALMARVVSEMGLRPKTAGSRAEARELLRNEDFEVIVADVALESPDAGLRLAVEARILRPGTPVVIVTGAPGLETALPAMRSGVVDYLAKPFRPADLRRAVLRASSARAEAEPAREELRGELAAAYSELKKVERVREAMQGVVEHELRTPMCIARMAADMLCREECGPDGRRARVLLEQGLTRLDAAIADVLMHARLTAAPGATRSERVSMAALAAHAAEALAAEAEAMEVRVETSGGLEDTTALGDRESLSCAVRHLLANAIRFNRRGGTARVRVVRSGDIVELVVSDDGPGIPPEHRARVFDAYYQAADFLTRSVGGLGLGLAIARAAFEGAGGGIALADRDGPGCEFRAWLPAASDAGGMGRTT